MKHWCIYVQDHVNIKGSHVTSIISTGLLKAGLTQVRNTARLRSELGGGNVSPWAPYYVAPEKPSLLFWGHRSKHSILTPSDARHGEPSLENMFLLREYKSPKSGPCSRPLQGLKIKLVSLQGKDASPNCNCFGAQKARKSSLQMIHHCQCSASGGQTLPSTLPEWAHCFQFLFLIIARHCDIYLITWHVGSTLNASWHLTKLTGNSTIKGIIKAHSMQQAAEQILLRKNPGLW